MVRTVLEPVLQGLQGLPPQAQAPALGQALTAILGAWLDHILRHGIRFRWGEKEAVAEGWMELEKARGYRWGGAVREAVEAGGHIVPWPSACRGRCSSDKTLEWSGSCWRRSSGACRQNFASLCSHSTSSRGWMAPCCVYSSSPCPSLKSTGGLPVAVSHCSPTPGSP